MFSQRLGLTLVRWQGEYKGVEAVWLRWATFAGDLLPTESELTEQERMRAEDLEALLQRYRERFGDLPE